MIDYKEIWKTRIVNALHTITDETRNTEITMELLLENSIAEIPPKPDMGDIGFPMFAFAKLLRKSPVQIAQAVAAKLTTEGGTAAAEGPYVNIRLNRAEIASALLRIQKNELGRPGTLTGKRIMVEFSSPNTNKPLHLGHLRNDILGESISRILKACGADIRKVCIINDRGVHICKSMLAYQKYGEGKTPESEHIKSDHFVGDWYVKFHQVRKEEPHIEEQAHEMLRKWEAGDAETVTLWKQMNNELRRAIHPKGVFSVQINKRVGRKDVVYGVAGFFFLYFTMVLISTLITAASGTDVFSSFSASLSIIGNVGVGFGAIGPAHNYSAFADHIKWLYSFMMIAGRLELWTVFILFSSEFWRK
jgi:arginyl-tRNA synthetase